MRSKLATLLFIISTLFVFQASAFAVSKEDISRADKLYYQGEKQFKLKNFIKAVKLMEKSFQIDPVGKVANNIGLSYDNLKNYTKAIKFYHEALRMGYLGGATNLALLYKNTYKDYQNAIKYYKIAIKGKDIDSIKGISYVYRVHLKDNLTSTAYTIALIDKKYPKDAVLNYLRNKLRINEETIKKAYKLQQTLVPNPYTGGIN